MEITDITDQTIEEVLKTDKLVIIKFGAYWCRPCLQMDPIIEQIHDEFQDVVVGKVDVDENSATSSKYGIRNIPTILFLKNGVIVDKLVGAQQKAKFVEKIEEHSKSNEANENDITITTPDLNLNAGKPGGY